MSLFKKWGDHIRLCIGFIMIALIWSSIENMYLEKSFISERISVVCETFLEERTKEVTIGLHLSFILTATF